jgi:hypothetical protein
MGQLNVNVLDPRAHIYTICEDSACFAEFLVRYLPNGVGHLVMYMDELKPGNQHLPGKGRSLHACYFNIMEFPDWFLSDADNWMSLAYITSLDMERAQVKEGQVLRYLLRYIFGLGASETLGSCDFRIKRNGEYMVIRLKFGCYLADCKSEFQFASSKGASALAFCPECLNVKKNPTLPGEVGSDEWDESKFVRHTCATYGALVDTLEQLSTSGASLKNLEAAAKDFGICFDLGSIPFDKELRSFVGVPTALYWDTQHILLGSGSIGQCEINGFLTCVLENTAITLADIDAFTRTWHVPKGWTQLRPRFFTERYNTAKDSNFRSFAGESITTICMLMMFIESVLSPIDIPSMVDHVECFKLLYCIVCLLLSHNCVFQHLETLEGAIREHHRLYVLLYANMVKPKLHYLRHVLDSLKRHGKLLNCFVDERKHKGAKQEGHRVFKNLSKHVLALDIRNQYKRFKCPGTFQHTRLVPPIQNASEVVALLDTFQVRYQNGFVSKEMHTQMGTFHVHSMVLFSDDAGSFNVGEMLMFLQCDSIYIALVRKHAIKSRGFAHAICTLEATPILIASARLHRTVACARCFDHVRVSLPIGV